VLNYPSGNARFGAEPDLLQPVAGFAMGNFKEKPGLLASAFFASTLGSLAFLRALPPFSTYFLTYSITWSTSSWSSPIFPWHFTPPFIYTLILLCFIRLASGFAEYCAFLQFSNRRIFSWYAKNTIWSLG